MSTGTDHIPVSALVLLNRYVKEGLLLAKKKEVSEAIFYLICGES